MALNPAWFNSLVDDAGDGVSGTIWNKAQIAGLIAAINAEIVRLDTADQHPACIVTNGGSQPFGSGVWADFPLTQEIYDPYGMHSGSDTRVYIPTAGLWAASATIQWPNVAAGNRYCTFIANDAFAFPLRSQEQPSAGGVAVSRPFGVCQFVAPGFVTLQMHQDSGASMTFVPNMVYLYVWKISN